MISSVPSLEAQAGARHRGWKTDLAVLVGFVGLVSAIWVESDLYRYAALGLVLWGLVVYFFLEKDFRPNIGAMGLACLAWTAYVGLRFAWTSATMPLTSHGSAEGIYLFPILYSTVGYVFFLYRDNIGRFLALFAVVSFLFLATTIDYGLIFGGYRGKIEFLIQNRTIHAAIAAGIIAIGATLMALDLASAREGRGRWSRLLLALSVLVMALALLGIYGSKSRGVWFALALTLPFTLVGPFSRISGRGRLGFGIGGVALVAILAIPFWELTWSVIEPVAAGILTLLDTLWREGFNQTAVEHAMQSADIITSLQERVLLWVKALDIWSMNWLFGVGIYWRTLWFAPGTVEAPFDLFHNGYLELGVRYGLLGFLFYGALFVWSLWQSRLCAKRGLIAPGLFGFHVVSLAFYLLTLLSNSNIRLAIGESYTMVFAGFGFCCFYLRQWEDWKRASDAAGKVMPAANPTGQA